MKITPANLQAFVAELTQLDNALIERLDAYNDNTSSADTKRYLKRDFIFASDLACKISKYCQVNKITTPLINGKPLADLESVYGFIQLTKSTILARIFKALKLLFNSCNSK